MALRVVFVCTGNICRSPTAEGVLRQMAAERGLADQIEVASAGLEDWHAGAPPDPRSQAHARQRGCDLSALRAQHFSPKDFDTHDLVIALDAVHHTQLLRMCPPARRHTLKRAADFSARVSAGGVPDPYYGTAADFEHVLDLVEAVCEGILAGLQRPPG